MLVPGDRLAMRRDLFPAVEHRTERPRACRETGGMALEHVEEALLMRHDAMEPAQHRLPLPVIRPAAS
jgi:hypothetical protein